MTTTVSLILPGRGKEKAEATNPATPSERLGELFFRYPLEVARNPNISVATMMVVAMISMNALDEKTFKRMAPKNGFAILWSLLENPVLSLLRLENPGHPIFEQIEHSLRRVRYELQFSTLKEAQFGAAFCQSMQQFLPIVKRYNAAHYRTWLYLLSALWMRLYRLPIPAHYGWPIEQELPVRRASAHPIGPVILNLSKAFSFAKKRAYRIAFGTLWSISNDLTSMEENHQNIVETMEAASCGMTWTDPAIEELCSVQDRSLRLG